ncbi:MAG: hypothetical protein R3E97_00035 [Candidatus Eisenbacteria bacterium]
MRVRGFDQARDAVDLELFAELFESGVDGLEFLECFGPAALAEKGLGGDAGSEGGFEAVAPAGEIVTGLDRELAGEGFVAESEFGFGETVLGFELGFGVAERLAEPNGPCQKPSCPLKASFGQLDFGDVLVQCDPMKRTSMSLAVDQCSSQS